MSLKFVEVVVLLVAGVLFFVWQMRDLRQARENTRRAREAQQRSSDPETQRDHHAP